MSGRGLLGKWGPNLANDHIITRWKLNENGSRVERQSKPVLEFVALRRAADKKWALPGGFARKVSWLYGYILPAHLTCTQDGILPIMRKAFGLTEESIGSNDELKELEEMLKTQGTDVFKGYMDDPRNTVNHSCRRCGAHALIGQLLG